MLDSILHDLRYGFRMLARNPLFTVAAVLALGLGIGANTAVFSVVNSLILRPLAYKDPDRLVVALHGGTQPVSPADFFDYRKSATSFEDLSAAQAASGNISGKDKPENVAAIAVTANLLHTLGVEPELGRVFRQGEDQPGAELTVVLSHTLWQRQFGTDRGVLGQKLMIDGVAHTVIGVMPPYFQFAPFWVTNAEMWLPLDLSKRYNDRDGRSLRVFGRLKPGASVETAKSEMAGIAHRLAEQYPATNTGLSIDVLPLKEKVISSIRPTLLVLLGTVAMVLLIACANVANLLLARATARRREIAIRIAIGAGRGRLIGQLLTESVLLAALGGGAGLLLGWWAIALLRSILPPGSLPRQGELGIDATALLFTAGVALLTGVVSGLLPALQFSQAATNEDLKDGSKGSTGSEAGGRTRGALVVAEVAVGLVLLAGAGLMIKTFARLQGIDPGFNPHGLLTFEVSVAGTPHNQDGSREILFRKVSDALTTVPGIEAVSAINHLPLAGDLWTLDFLIDGQPAPPPGKGPGAAYRVVRPKYFAAMQLPILRGRDFTEHDNQQAPAVAVINEAMAQRYWPGGDPVGHTFSLSAMNGSKSRLTIVGVAKDAKQGDWTSAPDNEVYVAYLQRPDTMGLSYLTFVARSTGDPRNLVRAVETAVWQVDRNLPVSKVRTMDEVIANTLWRARVSTLLLACFGAIALLLAVLGIYGVISYHVSRRTQEIGIRMALGADAGAVLRMALTEGMKPVLLGVAFGLAAAFVTTRFMNSLLYDVTPTDPATLSLVTASLIVAGFLANLIPAYRASRLNPILALRHD